MIVSKLESPLYHRQKREGLPGRGYEAPVAANRKSFDQYLLEAFQGEVVQEGKRFSSGISPLQRENLIKLGRV
ncbi:MAG TPA: hypothetical protein PKE49_05085 [Leptospiraceae bacterium]|nr:hypothetical protein [Leptospirales bacterium]HMU82121.1 hypothetical protein [Leptospiraceae bacterium]HMW59933.1 hypothetical protein [Leptospiraceae bacterium]HMX55874.1 hypothetical protein [Leptospiraceae bacterium]HMY44826.1 hypothetical protein [Leptospiraceae bacterium]